MSSQRYAYRIGWRSLRRVCPTLTKDHAQQLSRDLGQAMVENGITNRRRAAMFIAQTAHESLEYHYREEIASGSRYEGRKDLGNVHLGDGVRFKGRGYIEITGRANYSTMRAYLHEDFLAHPDRLSLPKYAAKSAAIWWRIHDLNRVADNGNFQRTSEIINGTPPNGVDSRNAYYRRARLVSPFLIPRRRKP